MSLENTRDIGTAKIVMVGAGGGTSYNAGTGIDITNNTIHNTECGARSGVVDSISSSRAHTLIILATNETFKAGETIILKSEVSGSASTLRVQYASSASSVRDFNFYETDGTTTKTVTFAVGTVVLVMLDQTGYKALVLSEDVSGGADALSDLTDTNISTPTNGQILEYNSTSGKWENKNNSSSNVVANPQDSATAELEKLKVSGTTYSTAGMRVFDVYSMGSLGHDMNVHVPDRTALDGKTIAVNTGSFSGTPSSGWFLYFVDGSGSTGTNMVDKNGNAYSDYISSNCLLFIKVDTSSSPRTSTILGVIEDNPTVEYVSKTKYQLYMVYWTADGSGGYTYTLALNPTIKSSPNVYLAGAYQDQPTDAELAMYKHIKWCALSGSNLILYADDVITTTSWIYIRVEGVEGTASTNYSGNVVPYNQDDNTHRPIKMNGTQILGNNTTSLNLVAGTNVTLSNSGGSVTINASGGGDEYALLGMGQVTSYSNKVANTNVYLHRAPKDGDRLFIHFPTEITDSDAQIKIYDEASGTAYTLSFSFWASGWKLYGLCLLGIADDGLGNLGLSLLYSFKGGTNYTAGTGIEINGSAISNTAPNYGVDVDGATISSVSSGNLGTYVGESKYLILYFSASASPYSGGYTLTLSYSGAVARYEYGTLYDGSSRYNSNISAGTMLLCEVTDTGTGSSADPVHVNIIGKIDPNNSGASTLSDLTDTSITSPSNGQVLTYDSTNSKWINSTPSGGGGDTVSKTRYSVSYSSGWSSSANSDGYYTKTISLSPSIKSSPNIYIAGSSDTNQPTDTYKKMYSLLERCALSASGASLTLYATSKPTSTFYIWVEGEEGTASSSFVGNIVPLVQRINGRKTYSWTANDSLTAVSNGIISHINEITPDSYFAIGDLFNNNYLIFRLYQYINLSNDKRITFSANMWNGVWTFVASNNTADIGIVQFQGAANNFVFTGDIEAGSGLITTWFANKYLVI